VITDRTDRPPESPPSPDQDLVAISGDFPGWEAWSLGLAGILYAKRSDPQIVVRSTTTEGLRAEIVRAERMRGLR
jgi:hypothetical protein